MVALVLTDTSKPTKAKGKKSAKKKTTEVKPPQKAIDVTDRIDKELVEKAVKALLKHHENSVAEKEGEKSQLLGTDTSIQVQFTLEVAPHQPSRKPLRIDIPHSIFNVSKEEKNDQLDEPEVCLIVKDNSKEAVKEMIEKFPEQMGFVKKVMRLESLRKKYAQYAQRRELLKKYSVFMADDRILPMLTSALGRDFIKAKKLPIPVNVTRTSSLPFTILKALSSTFMHLSQGTCVTVRAGYTHMTSDQIVENILAITENGVPLIPRKWANIRAIALKTPNSTSLPFYNKTPEELMEIARLAGARQVWKATESESKDAMEVDKSDTDDSPKKRKDIKSPLVQALKKQKKDAGNEESKKEKDIESKKQSAKENKDEVTESKTSKKQKKEQKEENESKTKEGKKSNKTVTAKGNDTKESMDVEKKDEIKVSKDKSASAKKSKRKSDGGASSEKDEPLSKKSKSPAKDTTKGSEGKAADFIASKKFTGSKKGYVFRAGSKGLGYYVDVKPVPDKAALAALARMAQQGHGKSDRRKSSGSMGKQKKGGKKSRGRRSF